MSHGSISPPSRLCSPSRDTAIIARYTASVADCDSTVNPRDNGVIFGVDGRFDVHYFFVTDCEVLISSRLNTAFRDGGLSNVTA